MTELLFDCHCPACMQTNNLVYLSINRGDLYECPECHLMVGLAPLRAVVIRRRGRGRFRDLANPLYSSRDLGGLLLVRERVDEHYEPDGFNHFRDIAELNEYLSSISERDDCC